MCGIAGIVSADSSLVSLSRLKRMTDAIAHRGPEGDGFWIDDNQNAGLGHRRLSIIDLSATAGQPMQYLDRYRITYNGELYNYREIRDLLQKKGYHFRTQSDTEVVLAAFACWRDKCLDHFDGMFSFAIWDAQQQTLFAARDRFGEKPFYYSLDTKNTTLVFASEMKALWSAGINREHNPSMLLDFIVLGRVKSVQSPAATFYNGIHSLPPAHCLYFDFQAGQLNIIRYYRLERRAHASPPENYLERFSHFLHLSVARRMRSDVPLGTSLSGGLDSSSIVATVRKMLGGIQHNPGLHTFSALFPGFGKDESEHVGLVCRHFGLVNHVVKPTGDGLISEFEKLCYHQEEPFGSASVYAQYKVFESARQHDITVLLDGQGADEVLAGYSKYVHWYLQELLRAGKYSSLAKELHALRTLQLPFSWGLRNYLAAWFPRIAAGQLAAREKKKWQQHRFIDEDLSQTCRASSPSKPVVRTLNDILYHDVCQSGLEELLRYADRNSMAHGREVRLPFLQHELVEYVFSLPASLKISKGFTKYVLRLAMDGILPDSIIWRTGKVGFEPPQKEWMGSALLLDYIHEAKKSLVRKKILKSSVLESKVQPQDAYAADNFDWRYLVADKVSG